MERNYVIVEKAFAISDKGTAINPKESLSSVYFGKKFTVLLETPDGGQKQSDASVESMLINASDGNEVFTFLLREMKPEEIPCNTKITILSKINN